MDSILSVRQLTEQIRQSVENRFPYVWVQGEVTNLSRPSSGHVYFSLKEDDCLLNCVWFKRQQKDDAFDPLTGEVWEDGPRPCLSRTMENGQTILCAGRLTVYGARGQYQMIIDLAQRMGQGLWYQEFEALKRRLAAEGLFDAEKKRPIPREPGRVAVITAPNGAAIRDFIRISKNRGLGAEIRIYPVPVQGEEAPPRIAEALKKAGDEGWAEVIALIRGGGSVQDLWAFNDERVARAIYHCPIPVLTGIGHEIDHSIADFTADFSAATPSHTAQILWQERHVFEQHIDTMESACTRTFFQKLDTLSLRFSHLLQSLNLLSPFVRLNTQQEKLENFLHRMQSGMEGTLLRSARRAETLENELLGQSAHIDALFSMLESLRLRLSAAGDSRMNEAEVQAEQALRSLLPLGRMAGMKEEQQLSRLEAHLLALDPFQPLHRGYAMACNEKGNILRSAGQASPGQSISILLSDGRIRSTVTAIEPAQEGGLSS